MAEITIDPYQSHAAEHLIEMQKAKIAKLEAENKALRKGLKETMSLLSFCADEELPGWLHASINKVMEKVK